MNWRQLALLGTLCSVAGVGCTTIAGSHRVKGGYDFAQTKKIAVVDATFAGYGRVGDYAGPSNQIVDLITREFFDRGYTTIERSQIENVLKEQGFQNKGVTSETDAVKIGKILNVPAIVIANVSEAGEKFVITVKVIDTETAEHLLMGDGKGDAHSKMTKLVSLAGGAVAGAGIGGAVGGKKGALIGGLGGAFGGLVAGEMLSEDLYDVAQKTIKKVFEGLPPKI